MRLLALFTVAAAFGCATGQPLVISRQQQKRFQELVRNAEAAGAAEGPPAAAAHLADAKSEYEYCQHLPKYPDRARLVLAQAQADAELALELARREAASRLAGRRQVLAGATAP